MKVISLVILSLATSCLAAPSLSNEQRASFLVEESKTGLVMGFSHDKICDFDSCSFGLVNALDVEDSCVATSSDCEGNKSNFVGVCQDGPSDYLPETELCHVGLRSSQQLTCPSRAMIVDFAFSKNKFHVAKGLKMHRKFNEEDVWDYECNKTVPDRKKCKGDRKFMENIGATGEDQNCYCEMKELRGSLMVDIEGVQFRPKCWGILKAHIGYDSIAHNGPECRFCEILCRPPNLVVRTYGPIVRHWKTCRGPICLTGTGGEDQFSARLPSSILLAEGTLAVELWFEATGSAFMTRVNCPVIDACSTLSCVLCYEFLEAYECWPWYMWVGMITWMCLVLITLNAALSILKKMMRPVKILFRLFFVLLKWIYYGFKRCCLNRINRVRLDVDIEEGVGLVPQDVTRFGVVLFCICLGLQIGSRPVFACATSSTISVSNSDCSKVKNGVQSCTIKHKTRLSVAPVGQDSCFTVLDEEGKAKATLSVTTNSLNLLCTKSLMYYTFDPSMHCSSVKKCSGTEGCDGGCPSSDSTLDRWSASSDSLRKTGCVASCGCAGCGCFYCTPGCLYYNGIVTSQSVYEIFECPTWKYKMDLVVSLASDSMIQTETISLETGLIKRKFNTSFQIITASPQVQSLTSKCFMKNLHKDLSITSCNRQNEISSGIIGEIQCPTYKDAKEGSSKCTMNHELVEIVDRGYAADCHSHFASPDQGFEVGRLPYKGDGLSVETLNELPVILLGQQSLVEIELTSTNFKIRSVSDKSSCFAEFISLTGCYNCPHGANLALRLKTDMGSTVGFLDCPAISMHVAYPVTEDLSVVNKTISFNHHTVETDCTFSCPSGAIKMGIKGTLIKVTNQVIEKSMVLHSPVILEHADVSVTIPSIWGRLWFWLVVIAVIILVLVILYFTLPLLMTKRAKIL